MGYNGMDICIYIYIHMFKYKGKYMMLERVGKEGTGKYKIGVFSTTNDCWFSVLYYNNYNAIILQKEGGYCAGISINKRREGS